MEKVDGQRCQLFELWDYRLYHNVNRLVLPLNSAGRKISSSDFQHFKFLTEKSANILLGREFSIMASASCMNLFGRDRNLENLKHRKVHIILSVESGLNVPIYEKNWKTFEIKVTAYIIIVLAVTLSLILYRKQYSCIQLSHRILMRSLMAEHVHIEAIFDSIYNMTPLRLSLLQLIVKRQGIERESKWKSKKKENERNEKTWLRNILVFRKNSIRNSHKESNNFKFAQEAGTDKREHLKIANKQHF
uniref:Uncharacterized protein n=1 Tax=Glossina brevipalpis TaxID=37001 RepID=A0A1A9WZI7_9MUSC